MEEHEETDRIMKVDFTKQMKEEYTILAPDIFPTHMELLEEVFRMYGYHVTIVHYEGRKVIDCGLKYLHNDVCYPAICTVGQLIYALECGDFDPHKTALMHFQTGGGCRASNYLMLLRKALERMGMEYVPVISLSFSNIEKYSGFHITPKMLLSGFRCIVYGDMMLLLKNQVLPYEKNAGDTDRVTKKWIKELSGQFRRGQGMTNRAMEKNLAAMAGDYAAIPRISKKTVRVGIVGEIYVKYSSFGNNGLEKFLLSQNCEYMVPGVLGFIQFAFANGEINYNYYGGSYAEVIGKNLMWKYLEKWDAIMRRTVQRYPEFRVPKAFRDIMALADKVVDRGVKMGEGWLLPGEVCDLIEMGYRNIICAQPFGCLPNHIVGKGTIRRLRELYPEANIFPVDYDSGASKVNQENRIKLMLAIAEAQ